MDMNSPDYYIEKTQDSIDNTERFVMPSVLFLHLVQRNIDLMGIFLICMQFPNKYIYAVNKKGVSCRKQGVSWTKIAFLFKCS